MTCLDVFFENFLFYSSSPHFTSQLKRQTLHYQFKENITFAHYLLEWIKYLTASNSLRCH